MNDLETSSPSAEDTGDSSYIPRLSFFRCVLEDDIAHFENLERERMFAVFSERLEESGEEGRSHDLVFDRFRVRKNDGGRSIVGSVEEGKVLVVGALRMNDSSAKRIAAEERISARESEGEPRAIPLRSRVVASCR